jgi:hypothetical protein
MKNETSLDQEHWAFINDWRLPDQRDDRQQMLVSVPEVVGSPAARRALARQSHQINYKVWSQERHE